MNLAPAHGALTPHPSPLCRPKDGDDWKDLLKRAVPWLVAAGIIAVGVSTYKQSSAVSSRRAAAG